MAAFQDAVAALYPSKDLLAAFSSKTIYDDKTHAAPHQQASNKDRMAAMQADLSQQVKAGFFTTEGQFNAKQWLRLEQDAMQALAIVCCLSTGITFCSWQFSSILYNCTQTQN